MQPPHAAIRLYQLNFNLITNFICKTNKNRRKKNPHRHWKIKIRTEKNKKHLIIKNMESIESIYFNLRWERGKEGN